MSDKDEPLEPLQEIEVAPGFKIRHTGATTEAAQETAAMFERLLQRGSRSSSRAEDEG